ncbi:MAG: TetR family transcriptional regulator [Bdellovibrionales bacterium]|nr:TetR family transcriptional regulator [Bdellovibrionales bacterium]
MQNVESVQQKKKEDVFWAVLSSAMELDVKKGPLKWTLSELSRKSKITRSLIYYYFGRSKMGIIEEAIKMIGEEFIGLSSERLKLWKEGQLYESMLQTRQLSERVPYLQTFIILNIGTSSEAGKLLEQKRQEFIAKIRTFYSKKTEDEVLAIFSMYWGLSFAPELNDQAIKIVLKQFKKVT